MTQEFTLNDLLPLLDLFDELNLEIWIDGGWGVDALLGKQTRSHQDLDFLIDSYSSDVLVRELRNRGFFDVDTNDHRPWNFVMGNSDGKNFDFHVLEKQADGDYLYGTGEEAIPVTAESLSGSGVIGGMSVRCPTPEFQIGSHTGYELHESDIHDVTLLSKKFGLELHPQQIEYLSNQESG